MTDKAIGADEANAKEDEDVNEAIVVVKAKDEEAIVADEAVWPIKPMRPMRLTKPLIVLRLKSMRPMSHNCKFFLLFLLMMAMPSLLIMCSHSPSQNILQSLQK